MIYAIISLGTLVILEALIIVVMMRRHKAKISIEDLASIAADLSARTHISYDTAMQSLIGLNNAYGRGLRK